MKQIISKHWPLIISQLILLTCVTVLIVEITGRNDGHYVYTFDDTYIHMAMAKNLSQHGVWGITQYSFTSCSSSLFWTSFIAFVYFLAGPNEITPLIISLFCALLIILHFHLLFKKEKVKPLITLISSVMLIYFVCLPYHIISGLEHTMHALVNIIFIYISAEIVSGRRSRKKDTYILISLAVLMPLLRFEGLVSVLLLCLLLMLNKRPVLSFYSFIAGIIPVTVFGIISVSKGWSFLPNSVLMKLNFPDIVSLNDLLNLLLSILGKLFRPFTFVFFVLSVVIFIFAYYQYRRRKDRISPISARDVILVSFYFVNAIFYFIFSGSRMASRYQHFLVAMALFIFTILIFRKFDFESRKTKSAIQALGIIVFVTSAFFWESDSYYKVVTTPSRSVNIYEQQYQMARFFKRYYPDKVIGLNDIGTTGYFTDAKIVDLWGLCDYEVSKMRKANYSKNDLRYLTRSRGLNIAFIYDSWLGKSACNVIPDEWLKVGEWKISNNIICGSDIVSLYAVNLAGKDNLIKNLREFSSSLPISVIQSGEYTSGSD